MKSKWILTCLALGSMLLRGSVLARKANQNSTSDKTPKARDITGCLAKGEKSNEYKITTRDGSTWELRSDVVDFAFHLGQTVTVTGTVNHAAAHGAKEKTEEKTMNKSTEHGHMTVTELKTVSDSCRR
jgi:hypothetical protein